MKTSINVVEADEIKQMNLPPQLVNDLQTNFNPLFEKAQEWKANAEKIVVTDINDTEGMNAAREARLKLKDIRVETEKIRVKLKEESLLKGKAIDGIANVIKFLVIPLEKHLEEQENFAKVQEQKRKDELADKRMLELFEFVGQDEIDVYRFNYKLGELTEEAYQIILAGAKKTYEDRVKAEKEAEEKRIEAEKARKAEEERLRVENEKLKQERDAKIKADEVERKKREVAEAKERTEREAKEMKERQAYETKIKAEREAKEKVEKELREKKEAEEKAAREEAARLKKLQTAPDKDKLRKLAADLLAVEYPDMQSEEGKRITEGVKDLVKKVNIYIVKNIENL